MDIFCACPFAVATLPWDPADGQHSVSVCVKATFVLAPGVATIAPMQEPVSADGAAGDAPDLVPYKPRADILFTGHAHAPGGGVTDSLLARARIGAFRKALSINGDRTWVPSFDGLRPSAAVPFRRMPLVYQRAVRTGENLTGVDISRGAAPNAPLANIAAIADQGGETPGLAPIPFGWRTHRLGLDDHGILWAVRAGLALGPPPPRFDFRIFNAAPIEQQVEEIPAGCEVLLENLHPQHAQLETRLPGIRVKIFQRGAHEAVCTEVPARCDTLWIDADRGLAVTLWRGLARREDGGQLVVVAEPEGEAVHAADVDRLLAHLAPSVTYVDAALLGGAAIAACPPIDEPLPFPLEPEPAPRRTTIAPPAPDEGAAFAALPFRHGPTGHDGGHPHAPGFDADEDTGDPAMDDPAPTSVDDEATPPFGVSPTALAGGPRHAPAAASDEPVTTPVMPGASSADLDDARYASARLDLWSGRGDASEALGRRGIETPAFLAYENALADALSAEAADGSSTRARSLLRVLVPG